MIQLRPTFSESWYRVAKLRARLRPTAQISRQYYRGERWYVVRDPAGNQFHRLSDPAYRFIGLLDGTRTVEEAWDLAGGQLADDAPTQPEVIQILSQLYAANLIESDVTPDATVLLRRHKSFLKRRMQNRLMNVLFPRIPLWDVDSFLLRWMPVVKPFLSIFGAILWVIVVGAALATIVPKWDLLKTAASNSIDPKNWLWLWVTFVFIKLIHELGHAFSCRRFGGEVHELGIMFLVMIPTPYVDASTAWAFPSRWHRMFVGMAGMVIELFFASLCAFVWANTNPTLLINQLAYNAMLIASVSTVIFNANPLLRYDGYYILSDFLEIPNLRQKSTEYAMGLIKRHVFRIKSQQPLPPMVQRVWLFFYAIASGIYRIFVGIAIIVLVAFKVPVLGVLMALGGVATWVMVPVFKVSKYLLLEPELHRKRGRAAIFVGACTAAAVLLLGIMPFWFNVRADGIVEPLEQANLFTTVPGLVTRIAAKDGENVQKNQVIFVMSDPELDARIGELTAQLHGLRIKRNQSNVEDQNEREIDDVRIESVSKQLGEAQKKHDELTIRAPIAGKLIAPTIDEYEGRYVQRGMQVATVAAMDKLLIRAVIGQDDAALVDANTVKKTEVRLTGMIHRVLEGKDFEMIGVQDQLPHPALGQQGGGDAQVEPRDPKGLKPVIGQQEVRVTLDNPEGIYLPGQRAYLKFGLDRKPLAWQWTRRFWQVIMTHQGKSAWL
jgi:putative peptide zinc metalloprotease protein